MIDFKFKKYSEEDVIYTSELYYDFFDGGYVDPEDMLEDEEQIKALDDARHLLGLFFEEAQEYGILVYT